LTPDFYISDFVEQRLAGHEFSDRAALVAAVKDILGSIEKKTLGQSFRT
jgi:hypothetical protein